MTASGEKFVVSDGATTTGSAISKILICSHQNELRVLLREFVTTLESH